MASRPAFTALTSMATARTLLLRQVIPLQHPTALGKSLVASALQQRTNVSQQRQLATSARPNVASTPPASASPTRPASGGAQSDSSNPIMIYEGSPSYSPLTSNILWFIFTLCGLVTGQNLREHAVWPLWRDKDGNPPGLMNEKGRWAFGILVATVGTGLGGLFKWAATKNITRITLFEDINDAARRPLLRIRVASKPLFLPRETAMIQRGRPKVILSGRFSREFVVPLSSVTRTVGSAVATGWVEERTKGQTRRSMQLKVGYNAYLLEASGGKRPVKEEDSSRVRYYVRMFEWLAARGSPKQPYFWSRKAFDELIPPIESSAAKPKLRIGPKA